MKIPFMTLGMIILTGWLFYINRGDAGLLTLTFIIIVALIESD